LMRKHRNILVVAAVILLIVASVCPASPTASSSDFTLTLDPDNSQIWQGMTAVVEVRVENIGDYTENVILSVENENLPQGVRITFNPVGGVVPFVSEMRVSVSENASPTDEFRLMTILATEADNEKNSRSATYKFRILPSFEAGWYWDIAKIENAGMPALDIQTTPPPAFISPAPQERETTVEEEPPSPAPQVLQEEGVTAEEELPPSPAPQVLQEEGVTAEEELPPSPAPQVAPSSAPPRVDILPIAVSLGVAACAIAISVWIGYRQSWGNAIPTLLDKGLHDMTVRDVEVVGYIMQRRKFTIPELMKLSKSSKITIWRTVQKLIDRGLVRPTDQTRPAANGLGGRGKPSRVYEYVG
jgi:hypothetical protein